MTTLTRILRTTAAAIAAVLLLSTFATAQTTLTNTTLASALSGAADQTMVIASATGWTATTSAAQTYALIDREVVGVRTVDSTAKIVGITRGQFGTRATGHANGVKVWFIPAGSVTISLFDRAGACSTSGSADQTQNGLTVPVFNPSTGNAFTCTSGGVWIPYTHLMGGNSCSVTQATNRTTGVTCTGLSGVITTNNASLAAEAAAAFTVTNTAVQIGDAIVVSQRSGSNGGDTDVYVSTVANGSFAITVANNNAAAGTAETGAILINFVVIKAVP